MLNYKNKHFNILTIVIAFGTLGLFTLLTAFAVQNRTSIEAEDATLDTNTQKMTDELASNNAYVEFDEDTTTDEPSDSNAENPSESGGTANNENESSTSNSSSVSGETTTDTNTDTSTDPDVDPEPESSEGDTGSSDDSGSSSDGSPGPSGPTLVFADEFDNGFNTTYWTKEHSTYGDGNNELQCYTPNQVAVTGGKLVITAEEQTVTCPNGSTRTVISGMIRSKNVEFSPGMSMEWSVKLTPADEDNQGGLWPALWASGWAGGGWPTGGEWDGFEVMTAVDPLRTVYSLHWRNSAGNYQKTSTPKYSAVNFSKNWHTFRFEYGADGTLVWSRDGYETKRVTTLDTQQGYPAPFDQDMKQIKINMALGGNPGALDLLALPATLEIGYIRIYQD